jgi:hypothetical protein
MALVAPRPVEPSIDNLPGAVVKVGVPRRPGAVEGERQLLVVLVLLTPHPEGGEHFGLPSGRARQHALRHSGLSSASAAVRYLPTQGAAQETPVG